MCTMVAVLQIEGTVEGNVLARCEDKCVLMLGESGVVQGEIRGPYIVIDGTVHGDVHSSESIELKAGARGQRGYLLQFAGDQRRG